MHHMIPPPDPNCPKCQGKGVVHDYHGGEHNASVSIGPCECVKFNPAPPPNVDSDTKPAPDPTNDPAMAELHRLVREWVQRNNLSEAKEAYYLAHYLAGRLDVHQAMEAVRKWTDD